MSFNTVARKVRDESLPLGLRVRCFHQCLEYHGWRYGFQASLDLLRNEVRASGYRPLQGRFRQNTWTERELMRALEFLEASRQSWLEYERSFAERRRQEKKEGRRQPRRVDMEELKRPVWTKPKLPLP